MGLPGLGYPLCLARLRLNLRVEFVSQLYTSFTGVYSRVLWAATRVGASNASEGLG